MDSAFPTQRGLALTGLGSALAGVFMLWVGVTPSDVVPKVCGWVAGICGLAVGFVGLWMALRYDAVLRRHSEREPVGMTPRISWWKGRVIDYLLWAVLIGCALPVVWLLIRDGAFSAGGLVPSFCAGVAIALRRRRRAASH